MQKRHLKESKYHLQTHKTLKIRDFCVSAVCNNQRNHTIQATLKAAKQNMNSKKLTVKKTSIAVKL